jgi:PIN domain nuclease of toxin-antitoxin system
MRLLLDTHIWLWSLREPDRLSSAVHKILSNPTHERFLSPISIWELTIQLEKKRVQLKEDFTSWFVRTASDLELAEAPLTWRVVHEMRHVLPYHEDPADRLIVATAIAYDLILVTADTQLVQVPGLKVLTNV